MFMVSPGWLIAAGLRGNEGLSAAALQEGDD
jgi:hypothetical protein